MHSCSWKLYITKCPLRLHCIIWGHREFVVGFFFFFDCEVQHVGSHNQGSQGWNPCPLEWEYRILTTGLPGKSPWGAF